MAHFIPQLALLFLCAPFASAQVFADEFDNGIRPDQDGWDIQFDPTMIWHFDEANGNFEVTDLGTTFPATQEQLLLDHSMPPLTGELSLEFALNWNDNVWVPPGFSHNIYEIHLRSGGTSVASFRIFDHDQSGGGQIEMAGAQTDIFAGIPIAGDIKVVLKRDVSDQLTYDLSGSLGAQSGSLGAGPGTIDQIGIVVEHTTRGGPGREMLGETYLDYVRVFFDGFSIEINQLVAGAHSQVRALNATPSGLVTFAYSLAGGGPTNTPFGVVDLSHPIKTMSPVTMNPSGSLSFPVFIGAAAAGFPVWIQALDMTSGDLSNGLSGVIQ